MANITKASLLDAVAGTADVSKADAEKVLTAFFDQVTTSAKAGDRVAWPGFGSFSTSDRAARMGRNPQTGASVRIKASKAMRFQASATLKDALNSRGAATKASVKKASAKKGAASKSTAKKSTAKKAAKKR